jgi:tight adherence protein B
MDFGIAVLTFAFVALVLLLGFGLVGGRRKNVIERRLEAIERGVGRGSGTGTGSPQLKVLRDEVLSGMPLLNRWLARARWAGRLRGFIAQAGLEILPGKLILMCAVLGLGIYIAVMYFYPNVILAVLLGAIGAVIPIAYVAFKRTSRMRAFEKSFPEAVDLLGRAVRAGHAFTTGLEMVSTELPDPVAGEFKLVFDEQSFGLPLRDALTNLAERVPIVDVRFFVTALLIHKETGGNLAAILDDLSSVIRDRFKLLRDVRVRTAQGRLTAGILIALPPAMVLLMRTVNPDYVNVLFTDPIGHVMLGGAAALQLVGSFVLWRVVNIQV